MKKGIKWLKGEVGELNLVDTVFEADGVSYIDTAVSVMQVYDLIDELDEQEVLSREWLDENKSSWTELKVDGYYIPVEKLQNLLVPKQGELETKIQELIESYKQEEDAYSNPENGWISGFIEDLKNLVEKEQKYYVDLDTAAYVAKWNGNGQVDIYTDGISGSDEFEFHLTEQEIKDYDERFWPFAVKVEELEE